MPNFVSVTSLILRPHGPFMNLFLPESLNSHREARKYIAGRFSDFIKHRVQQGKQHDQ